jgi:hypothetical protein
MISDFLTTIEQGLFVYEVFLIITIVLLYISHLKHHE